MTAHENEHLELTSALDTKCFGQPHRFMKRAESTNDEARSWAKNAAPEGALVWADHQTAGRGRRGSTWHTEPGKNLTFSLVLRPSFEMRIVGLIPLMAGLAVSTTLASMFDLPASLEWPNDVLIEGKKCAGILCESSTSEELNSLILGIGVNVNQQSFPETYNRPPTSIALQLCQAINRTALLCELLAALERWYDLLQRNPDAVIKAYEKTLIYMNKPVQLWQSSSQAEISGCCRGISSGGGLLIETKSGIRTVYAGEVTSDRSNRQA